MITLVLRHFSVPTMFACALLCAVPGFGAEQRSPTESKETKAEQPTDPLLKQVANAIDVSEKRFLTANVHTPWQIMHGLLALRQEYMVKDKNGKKIKAIDWISSGPHYKGDAWFQKTRFGGQAHPYSTDYAFEGHPNQFLAILAMADVPLTHKLKTDRGTITIADMVRNAKAEIKTNEEVTWTLWALSHYLGPDSTWENKYGETWSIERLVRIQTQEATFNGACGGSHGLFALTYARNVFLKTKQPLRGHWLAADQKIQKYIAQAKSLQNTDGTFSTEYFESRGHSRAFEKRLNTSGHTLEFVVSALPQERLKEQWVRNGIAAIAKDLVDNRLKPAECGSLYHAMNGLVIYRDKTNPPSKTRISVVAKKPIGEAPKAPKGENANGSGSKK